MKKDLAAGFFIFYLCILVWIIVFKMQFSLTALHESFGDLVRDTISWVPFQITGLSYRSMLEFAQNAAIFIPFGILPRIFAPKARWLTIAGSALLVSLGFELVQYVFRIGYADATDVAGNVLGALTGVILYDLVLALVKKRSRTDTLFLLLAAGMLVCSVVLFYRNATLFL